MKTIAVSQTAELGLNHTQAFLDGVVDYGIKNKTDKIGIDQLTLMKSVFDKADINNSKKFTGTELQAFFKIASWKSECLKYIVDACQRYAAKNNANAVPIDVVDNMVTLVNMKIDS